MVSRVVVAARIAREFLQPFVEGTVDVERSGQRMTGFVVDPVCRVDRLEHEAVAHAQPLVGRLELLSEVGFGAVARAHAVEVHERRGGGRRGGCGGRGGARAGAGGGPTVWPTRSARTRGEAEGGERGGGRRAGLDACREARFDARLGARRAGRLKRANSGEQEGQRENRS